MMNVNDAFPTMSKPVGEGIDRAAHLRELAAFYHAQCQACCKDLLSRQRKWKQELQPSATTLPEDTVHTNSKPTDKARANLAKDSPTLKIGGVKKGPKKPLPSTSPSPGKQLSRRGATWKNVEREALRRALLAFGIGRLDKVRSSMRSSLREIRHGLGDLLDASWHFLMSTAQQRHTDPKDRVWAERRLAGHMANAERATSLVGQWDKIGPCASTWIRRLRMLDQLGEVVRLLASPEAGSAAREEIQSLRDATVPAAWWNPQCDIFLLLGVFKHGYGAYETLRVDPDLASAFAASMLPAGMTNASGLPGKIPSPTKKALVTAGPAVEGGEVTKGDGHDEMAAKVTAGKDRNAEPGEEALLAGRGTGSSDAAAVGGGGSWPDAYSLTRRLKRLIEHLLRLRRQLERSGAEFPQRTMPGDASGEGDAKLEETPFGSLLRGLAIEKDGPGAERTGRSGGEQAVRLQPWNKRKKLGLIRTLLVWGLPASPGGGVAWKLLRERAIGPEDTGGTQKGNAETESAFEDVLGEVQRQVASLREGPPPKKGGKRLGGGFVAHPSSCPCLLCWQSRRSRRAAAGRVAAKPSPGVLTQITAVRLQERLELMEILRRAEVALGSDWGEAFQASYRGQELPPWWRPWIDDQALCQGVLKHGYGNWNAIFRDPSLPFSDLFPALPGEGGVPAASADGPANGSAEEAPLPENAEGERLKSKEEKVGLEGAKIKETGRGYEPPPLVAVPSPKILAKRLKYLERILRRHLSKKAKVSRKRPLPAKTPRVQPVSQADEAEGQLASGSGAADVEVRMEDEEGGKRAPPRKKLKLASALRVDDKKSQKVETSSLRDVGLPEEGAAEDGVVWREDAQDQGKEQSRGEDNLRFKHPDQRRNIGYEASEGGGMEIDEFQGGGLAEPAKSPSGRQDEWEVLGLTEARSEDVDLQRGWQEAELSGGQGKVKETEGNEEIDEDETDDDGGIAYDVD